MNIVNLKTIFIIDDDMADTFILKKLINSCSPHTSVVSFEDINQAILYFSSLEPPLKKGVILLDLYIKPDWAWDFLEEYKQQSPHCLHSTFEVYIMSSATNYESEYKMKIGKGVKEYLKKPVGRLEIEKILA